ncbi:MAG: hypothetical protein HYX87_04090 [Chloroflexi bacterium]|nr:hypothetical protein [Chloroflexota bacterium]
MSYQCPTCKKISATSLDLARHMIGRGDKSHRDWINSKGLKYSELLAMQFKSFGGEGYKALAEVLERDARMPEQG